MWALVLLSYNFMLTIKVSLFYYDCIICFDFFFILILNIFLCCHIAQIFVSDFSGSGTENRAFGDDTECERTSLTTHALV